MMSPSANCIALTKSFESCKLVAYHGEDDPPDVWTIGWGETIGVYEGLTWTQEQADAALLSTLSHCAVYVAKLVDVALSQNQIDALCDFVYEEGVGALRDSTLLKRLNASDFAGASAQFLVWDIANGKSNAGIERRRVADRALFDRPS